jgi:O-antigen ligase
MMTLTNTAYAQPVAPVWGPPGYSPTATPATKYRLGFFLFILVNAAIFMRPTEIFPEYLYAQSYQFLILGCLLCSVRAVTKQLTARSLAAQPITVCILGLIFAIMLSHLTRFAIDDAITSGLEFSKIALYYLLFVGLVTTPARLQQFLWWLAVFIVVHSIIATLQFLGMVNFPYFAAMYDFVGVDRMRGGDIQILRLCGSGIFHNPNEFCYPAGMAMMVFLFFVSSTRTMVLLRVLCIPALGVLGYAVTLTHSRGGFIGLLIGVISFLFARYGWRKACLIAAALIPILFLLFAGRQTNLDVDSGTGQQRIQLWNDGLVLFTRAPLFGIGTGLFREKIGHVVHNTYLQAYSELGFFGGTIFLGAFYCSLWVLYRIGLQPKQIADPELQRFRPYLVGLVGGFMGCMLTMSLTDMLPTYSVLGLVTAYVGMTGVRPPVSLPRFNFGFVLRMAMLSALTLVAFRLYVWHTFIPG